MRDDAEGGGRPKIGIRTFFTAPTVVSHFFSHHFSSHHTPLLISLLVWLKQSRCTPDGGLTSRAYDGDGVQTVFIWRAGRARCIYMKSKIRGRHTQEGRKANSRIDTNEPLLSASPYLTSLMMISIIMPLGCPCLARRSGLFTANVTRQLG